MFKPEEIKPDFPILQRQVHGHDLVYLDNAATSQKPQLVLEVLTNYYQQHHANIHRGVHQLADESTQVWLDSRQTIAGFFGAQPAELILTRNTTEAINGVAYGWADHQLQPGDVILTSLMEHHSNLVVWQQVGQRTGAKLVFVDLTAAGQLDWADFKAKLKTLPVRLVALVHVSNTLGTVNPVAKIVALVKQLNQKKAGQATQKNQASDSAGSATKILIDAAQSAPHMPLNFAQLGVDFLAFSGHKMLGPMGIGGLLVSKELLQNEAMKPWLFGGGMIGQVQQQHTEFADDLTDRFTAGTPDVASAVGLAAACDYLTNLGMEQVQQHDQNLVSYAYEKLSQIPGIKLVGPKPVESGFPTRLGSVSFIYQGAHPHDVAQVLDSQGIAVRSGHHCTMPLHQHFKWPATIRASFQVYNTKADVDRLVEGLQLVPKILKI